MGSLSSGGREGSSSSGSKGSSLSASEASSESTGVSSKSDSGAENATDYSGKNGEDRGAMIELKGGAKVGEAKENKAEWSHRGNVIEEAGETPENKEIAEQVEKEKEETKAQFHEFYHERYADASNEKQMLELMEKCEEINRPKYEAATEISKLDPDLKTYTDHGYEVHVRQVYVNTMKSLDAIEKTVEADKEKNGLSRVLTTNVNERTLVIAALAHDTGMDGRLTGKDPEELRDNYREAERQWNAGNAEISYGRHIRECHAQASALNILENAQEYRQVELNAAQEAARTGARDAFQSANISEAALVAALHTKKNSGVKDLSNPAQIASCSERLELAARENGLNDAYDPSFLYQKDTEGRIETDEEGNRVVDKDAAARVATGALALREGDAFRPAMPVTFSQSEVAFQIDGEAKEGAQSLAEEVSDVTIAGYDREGKAAQDVYMGKDAPDSVIGKMYILGEQNVCSVENKGPDENGNMVIEYHIADAGAFPRSTAMILHDRQAETNTVSDDREILGKVRHIVVFDDPGTCTKEKLDALKQTIEERSTEISKAQPFEFYI